MTLYFKIGFFLSCLLFTALSFPPQGNAEPSSIEIVQDALSSMVGITAETIGMVKNPKPSAVIDKATGRMLILRNAKAAYFKKTGAGVLLDRNGVVATNFHVIAQSNRITVTLQNLNSVPAKILLMDPPNDLALLLIHPAFAENQITIADSDGIRLGDTVYNIGQSQMLDQTISEGQVIGIGTSHSNTQDPSPHLFQVNMNLFRGDSGGPLLNRKGQLIGLIVAGQIHKDRSTFAVSSNAIRNLYGQYRMVLKNQ